MIRGRADPQGCHHLAQDPCAENAWALGGAVEQLSLWPLLLSPSSRARELQLPKPACLARMDCGIAFLLSPPLAPLLSLQILLEPHHGAYLQERS